MPEMSGRRKRRGKERKDEQEAQRGRTENCQRSEKEVLWKSRKSKLEKLFRPASSTTLMENGKCPAHTHRHSTHTRTDGWLCFVCGGGFFINGNWTAKLNAELCDVRFSILFSYAAAIVIFPFVSHFSLTKWWSAATTTTMQNSDNFDCTHTHTYVNQFSKLEIFVSYLKSFTVFFVYFLLVFYVFLNLVLQSHRLIWKKSVLRKNR